MNYQGIIFDLGGVTCSTDEYHYLAWKAIADELGIPFDRTVNDRLRDVSHMDSLEIILERYAGPDLTQTEKESLLCFGINWRIRLFVFSLVGRSHGDLGWA